MISMMSTTKQKEKYRGSLGKETNTGKKKGRGHQQPMKRRVSTCSKDLSGAGRSLSRDGVTWGVRLEIPGPISFHLSFLINNYLNYHLKNQENNSYFILFKKKHKKERNR